MESQAPAQSLRPLKELVQWLPMRVPKILAMVRIVQHLSNTFSIWCAYVCTKRTKYNLRAATHAKCATTKFRKEKRSFAHVLIHFALQC